MSCSKCNIEISKDDLNKKIRCDKCKAQYCHPCSGVNSTEIRVLQLAGSRKLKFICDMCENQPEIQNSIFDSIIEDKIKSVTESLQKHLDDLVQTIRMEFVNSSDALKAEVVMLRESNIEMINLLTNKPKIVSESCQDPIPNKNKNVSSIATTSSNSLEKNSSATLENNSRSTTRYFNVIKDKTPNINNGVKIPRAPREEYVGTDLSAGFSGVERMKHLHLNNVSPGVTEDQVGNYLMKKHGLGKRDFSIKILTSNENYCSFKIGVRQSSFDSLLCPDAWPAKATVREFLPHRPKDLRRRKTAPFLGE